jgi:hypothetical protein
MNAWRSGKRSRSGIGAGVVAGARGFDLGGFDLGLAGSPFLRRYWPISPLLVVVIAPIDSEAAAVRSGEYREAAGAVEEGVKREAEEDWPDKKRPRFKRPFSLEEATGDGSRATPSNTKSD